MGNHQGFSTREERQNHQSQGRRYRRETDVAAEIARGGGSRNSIASPVKVADDRYAIRIFSHGGCEALAFGNDEDWRLQQ